MDGCPGLTPCRCCGMTPTWFGDATWCLCEPPPADTWVSGPIHECGAERRLHRHRFTTLIAEETRGGRRLATIFHCACGQERRMELSAPGI